MNKLYFFVESKTGRSKVTILSLFQALPTDLYSSKTLFLSHEKRSTATKSSKRLFFILIFFNNYWFSWFFCFILCSRLTIGIILVSIFVFIAIFVWILVWIFLNRNFFIGVICIWSIC